MEAFPNKDHLFQLRCEGQLERKKEGEGGKGGIIASTRPCFQDVILTGWKKVST